MALKFELEQWNNACVAFDNQDYDTALSTFISLADNAKMHFNIGLIFATLDDHQRALAAYNKALRLDQYFAVVYFQKGVSHFIMGDMEAAMQDFDDAYSKLRGNQIINYTQLGLSFRLYSCEVLFNRGICRLYLQKMNDGLTDLYLAQKDKMTEEHEVIDQAVLDRGKGYSVFSIPPGVLFRPPESRLRGPQSADLLSAAEKFGLGKINPPAAAGIKRNNSILLGQNKFSNRQPPPPRAYGRTTPFQESPPPTGYLPQRSESIERSPMDMNSPKLTPTNYYRRSPLSISERPTTPQASYRQQSPQRQYSPRTRNDSSVGTTDDDSSPPSATTMSTSSYGSNQKFAAQYSDGRRIDSGFESNHEDRFSNSSARNSSRSQKTNPHYSPPPVPPMPVRHGGLVDENDSRYGNNTSQQLEDELNGVYEQLREMSVDKAGSQGNDGLGPYYSYRESMNQSPITRPPGPSSVSSQTSGPKIKIKVHYRDTRMLVVSAYISFHGLLEKIHEKFDVSSTLRLQYKDEDDELVLMIDQDDLDLARQISRAQTKPSKENPVVEKLELWCIE
ncbi:hypothetical protein BC943DRAFT_382327 [Umbelopsis sp. AD052]|nr:hypothetical protein BC943DRAFT_382327 [Umbelopsis sp. AD052]